MGGFPGDRHFPCFADEEGHQGLRISDNLFMVIQLAGYRFHSNSKTLQVFPIRHPPTCTGVPQVSLGGGLATEQRHSTEAPSLSALTDLPKW